MRLGFLGLGNMGSAILNGLINSNWSLSNINLYDTDKSKTHSFRDNSNIKVLETEIEVVKNSDIIILAVKPNYITHVLEKCKSEFNSSKVLVSVAVSVPISFYKKILGEDIPIIRTMPNTPALVGEGMTIISKDQLIKEDHLKIIVNIFDTIGKVELMDENLIDEVTALTGSSPAYVYMFIEAMSDFAVLRGIPRDISYRLAAQAVLGSAKMVIDTKIHPGELKDRVCSPGGSTIEAVYSLEKNGFRYSIMNAMDECTKKVEEISDKFKN